MPPLTQFSSRERPTRSGNQLVLTSVNRCKLQSLVGYMAVVGRLVAFFFSGPDGYCRCCRLAWVRLKVSSLASQGGIMWVDISSVVLLMRVHALWQKNKLLGIFLTILAVVSISMGVALLSVHPGVSEFIGRSQYGVYIFYREL